MVRESSKKTFQELRLRKIITNMQFKIVMHFLYIGNTPLTRRQLHAGTGIREPNISGRVNELLHKDYAGEPEFVKDGEGIKRLNVLFNPDERIMLEAKEIICPISKFPATPVFLNLGKKQVGLWE